MGLDQLGIALPMSLLTLLLLASLSMAFVTLAQTEPIIAGNHLRGSQARAMAEAGIERAIWALTNATSAGAFGGTGTAPNIVIGLTAGSPYDGSAFVPLTPAGGFELTVTGSDPNLRTVRSVGWSPTNDLADPRSKGRSQIVASLVRLRNLARESPCALCVRSSLNLAASVVDARGSEASNCESKVAAYASTSLAADPSTALYGAGAPAGAATNTEGRDWVVGGAFDFLPTTDDLDTLKALAALRGTYVRAVAGVTLELAGVPSGLVFIDTPDGTNTISASNLATVRLRPGFSGSVPFSGWIIVNGDVALERDFGGINGLLYAANTLAATDMGASRVTGMVIVRQLLGGGLSAANMTIVFDCAAARGAGLLPEGWFVKPGSYCDASTGC